MFAGMLGGFIGAAFGAILIAGVLHVVFRLLGGPVPRFANLWKASFAAQAVVIVANGIGSELLSGAMGALLVLAVGLAGAFVAYARLLEEPDGMRMGRRAAALALGTHVVFSIAMFVLVYPVVMRAIA
jgi:hypothetical protein